MPWIASRQGSQLGFKVGTRAIARDDSFSWWFLLPLVDVVVDIRFRNKHEGTAHCTFRLCCGAPSKVQPGQG